MRKKEKNVSYLLSAIHNQQYKLRVRITQFRVGQQVEACEL